MIKQRPHIDSSSDPDSTGAATQRVMQLLEGVPDPEVPVLNIIDLGIVREIELIPPAGVIVVITPTYTGCPAMDVISMNIRMTLGSNGYAPVDIRTTLSPPWTTEWMSEAAKQKLEAFGFAPPNSAQSVCHLDLFQAEEAVRCPRCHSYHTGLISRFGSTACKALYRCNDCKESFDYFKCH